MARRSPGGESSKKPALPSATRATGNGFAAAAPTRAPSSSTSSVAASPARRGEIIATTTFATASGSRSRHSYVRCAIYARKSSEEGLEQAFNSLHAQREACEAYVLSQRHEGWMLVPTVYDDGGFSGGSMDRPALRQLIADLQAGQIDVVVVYKIDRLTRSLFDFARIVEVLDAAKASFVSITQSFNTTTSMGRLTLNVLLSFAQFEREVTGERIRDKIAASKAKGMFMGGNIPLGYDLTVHTLVPNEQEAELVRFIFNRWNEHGSIRRLKQDLDARGARTKKRSNSGGNPFCQSHLRAILANPVYIGKTRHREQLHAGRHQPIIDKQVWDKAQEQIAAGRMTRKTGTDGSIASLLAGKLRDGQGQRYGSTHAGSRGRRFRYYCRVEQTRDGNAGAGLTGNQGGNPDTAGTKAPSMARAKQATIPGDDAAHRPARRLPAIEVERIVVEALTSLLADPHQLLEAIGRSAGDNEKERAEVQQGDQRNEAQLGLNNIDNPEALAQAIKSARHHAEAITRQGWQSHLVLLRTLIIDVTIHADRFELVLDQTALRAAIGLSDETVFALSKDQAKAVTTEAGLDRAGLNDPSCSRETYAPDGSGAQTHAIDRGDDADCLRLVIPVAPPRRHRHGRLVLKTKDQSEPQTADPVLVEAIDRARRWYLRLLADPAATTAYIADAEGKNRGWVSSQMQFAFLAPDIEEAIRAGKQAERLNLADLGEAARHSDWDEQRLVIGDVQG